MLTGGAHQVAGRPAGPLTQRHSHGVAPAFAGRDLGEDVEDRTSAPLLR